jgi:hypothetical protein
MQITITSFTSPITSAILLPIAKSFKNGSVADESFIAIGSGVITERETKYFSLQVVGNPVSATSWNVILEGSLDGVNFDTIMSHDTAIGNGKILFSGSVIFPILYYRCRIDALVLGPASEINVFIMGKG